MKKFFLILAAIGFVIPYLQFVPFLQENGLDFALFFEQMFANRIAAFFAWDVLISAMVLLVFIAADRRRTRLWWLAAMGLVAVGVSFAFPLYLYMRED